MKRKLAIGGLAAVVLLTAAVALIPRFIDWEKARGLLEEKGSAALGRDLKIASIRVGLFSGIRVEGFSIGPRPGFSGEPLVKTERMMARYRLFPLLMLRVVIHKIELNEPGLTIERNRKGEFSFADLFSGSETPAGEAAGAEPVSLPVSIDISEIRIIGGRISYRDATFKPAIQAELADTDVTVRHLTLSGAPAWVELKATAKARGRALPVRAKGSFSFGLSRSVLGIHDVDLEIPGLKITANGEISEVMTLPRPDIEARMLVDLEEAWNTAASLAREYFRPAGLPKGKVAVEASIAGTSKKPRWQGKAALEKVSYRNNDGTNLIENMEGEASFSQDHFATADLRFIALGNPFALQADVRDLGLGDLSGIDLKKMAPRAKFVLTSPRVILDALTGDSGDTGEGPADKKGGKAESSAPMQEPDLRRMVPAGLSASGEVRIDRIKFLKMEITGHRMTLTLKNRKLSFSQEAGICGGRQAVSGELDMTVHPVRHSVSARAEKIQAGPFVDGAAGSFLEAKTAALLRGRLSGTADARAELTGRGLTPENLKDRSAATGNLTVADGMVARPEMLAKLGKLLGQDWLGGDLSFRSLGGDFSYAKRRITTPGFVMDPGKSGELHANFRGDVDLDSKIKGELTTRFHPRHADSLMRGTVGQLQFSRADDGWVVGEWEVKGSLTKPVLVPSTKNVKKRAAEKAKEELKEQVPKLKEEGKKLLKKFLK